MNNLRQAKHGFQKPRRSASLKTTWRLRRRYIDSHAVFLVTAISAAFGAGSSAFGQECNFRESTCPDAATCPAGCTIDCDPNLAHGKRAHAACPPTGCLGEPLSCTGTTEYADEFLDVIRYDEACNIVNGAIRVPETGSLPIAALLGNAVCTDANGTCNPLDGSNCAFPCLVAAGGVAYSDPTTGLILKGMAFDGRIRVKDDQYVIKPSDVGSVACEFNFVSTDLGTSCCSNCPRFCGTTKVSARMLVPGCGNGICEPSLGENCLGCPTDCNGQKTGKPSTRFCCGADSGEVPGGCDDLRCTSGGFACTAEPVSSCCGDGTCGEYENNCNCAVDCGPAPLHELPGATCADGIDNDCDGLIDGQDPDCPCSARGAPCTSGTDCCSGTCLKRGACR